MRPLCQRLATVLVVVAGLVGMHHLTALGCSAPPSQHASIHHVHDSSAVEVHGEDAAGDSVFDDSMAWAICLALLVVLGVIRPAAGVLFTRRSRTKLRREFPESRPRDPDPPDLHALSISRT